MVNVAPLFITILLIFAPALGIQEPYGAQKGEFIELLMTLPTKGEFYTEEAIQKAGPYLPVLLSLTEEDIEKYDLYAFAAISRGLGNDKTHRAYVLAHFTNIRHPQLKLFWAATLFKANDVSLEIVRYLRDALNEPKQAELLAGMVGPDFKFFKRKVRTHTYANDGGNKILPQENEGHADWVSSVAFSPDGKTLVSGSHDGTLILWEVATGKQVRSIEDYRQHGRPFEIVSVAFSPDGHHIIADSGPIQIWDISTGSELQRLDPQGSGFGMALSPDGERLLLGEDFKGYLGMIELWDVVGGKVLRRFPQQEHPVDCVAFAPDGKTAASESRRGDDIDSVGLIKLWDLSTGAELRTLEGHKRRVAAIAFAPDGKTLASGSWDHSVKLWSVATGKEIRSFPPQPIE